MAEIVNLRRVKKARQKADDTAQAAANRAQHGRTRAERDAQAKTGAQSRRLLDGARLTKDVEP